MEAETPGLRAVEVAASRNVVADGGGIAHAARHHPGERMPADEQQLKDDHRQAEEVVLWQPIASREILALQFGRLILGNPDLAAEDRPPRGDLKTVAVDEGRSPPFQSRVRPAERI